ncbi:MAG TPA: ROK family protein [Candidatus Kapabacteria bacterium]|nr:ROK family protein [Candidatus Kapabacteria bacterium]
MYLGIDIGGSNFKYAISNLANFEIDPYVLPINYHNSKEQVLNNINKLIENNQIDKIGIGIPGVISLDGVIQVLPNLPDWEGFDIKSFLTAKQIPTYIDNDANIATLAELYEGNGKYLKNFLYITLGTGIGAGIIINRQILRGDTNASGEIGHTIIDRNANSEDFEPKFRTGIVEEFAGRKQILNYAKLVINQYPNSKLNSIEKFDVADIDKCAEQGDKASEIILKKVAYDISLAIISSLNLLDLHYVIIGGGISASNIIINEIRQNVKLRVLPHIAKDLSIQRAKFTANTGVIGSLIAAKFLAK